MDLHQIVFQTILLLIKFEFHLAIHIHGEREVLHMRIHVIHPTQKP